jgi:hypothetical protein
MVRLNKTIQKGKSPITLIQYPLRGIAFINKLQNLVGNLTHPGIFNECVLNSDTRFLRKRSVTS